MAAITPVLWFDLEGRKAVDFYIATFPNSRELGSTEYPEGAPLPAGTWLTIDFELNGLRLQALNGGPGHPFTDAISLSTEVDGQGEVDRLWEAITGDGGEEGPCGWAKDRFGLWWQIVPKGMGELLSDPDPGRATRAMTAMMQMKKIDLAVIQAAADAV